ncbi:MAG: hypothetical protein IPO21_04415 [Bacteroidales bacterium]|nr:hypothetical protein [Bacteroidales bacterium]
MLLLLLYSVFKLSIVQTYLTNTIAQLLSEKLEVKVTIQKVDFVFFNGLQLDQVQVSGIKGDSLFFVNRFILKISDVDFFERKVTITDIELSNAICTIQIDSIGNSNFDFLKNIINSSSSDSTSAAWSASVNGLMIKNAKVSVSQAIKSEVIDGEIDFSNLQFDSLNFYANNITFENNISHFIVDNLSFKEKSGLKVKDFDGRFFMNGNTINMSNVSLNLNNSIIKAYFLDFSFETFKDFSKFSEKINIKATFEDAVVYPSDFKCFYSALVSFEDAIRFSGNINGTVHDFKAKDFRIWYEKNFFFHGDIDMSGLSDIHNTYIFIDVKRMFTNAQKFNSSKIEKVLKIKKVIIPEELKRLGQLEYKGNLTGYINDFVSYGKLTTERGVLATDIAVKTDSITSNTILKGKLKALNFELGNVLNNPLFGNLSLNIGIDGLFDWKNNIDAYVKGSISELVFNNYSYSGIKLDGHISKNLFDGELLINDKNINLDFKGVLNIKGAVPELDFTAVVKGANLAALNLVKDSLSSFSADIEASFFGKNIDVSRGNVCVRNLEYSNKNSVFIQSQADLIVDMSEKEKHIQLQSQLIDFTLNGMFSFKSILINFDFILHHYIPSLPHLKDYKNTSDIADFTFSSQIKDADNFFLTFYPQFAIANNSYIGGKYVSEDNYVQVNADFAYVNFNDYSFKNVSINTETENDVLALNSVFDCTVYKTEFEKVKASVFLQSDTIKSKIEWASQKAGKFAGELSFSALYQRIDEKNILGGIIDSGSCTVKDSVWRYSETKFNISESGVVIDGFKIENKTEAISVNGKITKSETDTLLVSIRDFQLLNLKPFINYERFLFEGVLDCNIYLQSALQNPKLTSDLVVDSLILNKERIGKLLVKSRWNQQREALELDAEIEKSFIKMATLKGDIFMSTKKLALNLTLDNLYLSAYKSLLKSSLKELKGYASGNISVLGQIDKPLFYGDIFYKGRWIYFENA